MENYATQPGVSQFILGFFNALLKSKDYDNLKEAPFANAANIENLYAYINMDEVGKALLQLKAMDESGRMTFMSNGLQWVNATVGANEKGFTGSDAKELAHLYVNLLALLAAAPTTFMKIGALTMFTTAPDAVKSWLL